MQFALDGSWLDPFQRGGAVAAFIKQADDQGITAVVSENEGEFSFALYGDPMKCMGFRTAIEHWFLTEGG